jgi:hypothetical protein
MQMNRYYFLSGQNFNDFRLLDYFFPNLNQAEDFATSNNYKLFLTVEEAGSYINQNVYDTDEGEAGWVSEG